MGRELGMDFIETYVQFYGGRSPLAIYSRYKDHETFFVTWQQWPNKIKRVSADNWGTMWTKLEKALFGH